MSNQRVIDAFFKSVEDEYIERARVFSLKAYGLELSTELEEKIRAIIKRCWDQCREDNKDFPYIQNVYGAEKRYLND